MKEERKSNIVLLIVLVIIIVLGVFSYQRYQRVMKASEEQQKENQILTGYTYGGVDKTGFDTCKDLVDTMIKNQNSANGEILASITDFAAADVYNRYYEDGKFDERLYKMITDVEGYVADEEYYVNSLSVMCAMLLRGEQEYITAANASKVEMELEELGEEYSLKDSKFLYEAEATIKVNDKKAKKKTRNKVKIHFITYDEGKTWYLINVENVEVENLKK